MKADTSGPKSTAANFAFIAFLFSVFAWALIETKLFIAAAGFRAHLLTAAFSLAVSMVALRRCRAWWALFADMDRSNNRSASKRFRISDVTSCVALVAAGCALALSAKSGSLAVFAICAGVFSLAPWSRFVFCRKHFFTSCSMLGAGAASIFIVTRPNADPLSYLLWAWFLWMYALVALLTTWSSKRPATSPSGPIDSALAANQNTGKISMREQAPTLPSGGSP